MLAAALAAAADDEARTKLQAGHDAEMAAALKKLAAEVNESSDKLAGRLAARKALRLKHELKARCEARLTELATEDAAADAALAVALAAATDDEVRTKLQADHDAETTAALEKLAVEVDESKDSLAARLATRKALRRKQAKRAELSSKQSTHRAELETKLTTLHAEFERIAATNDERSLTETASTSHRDLAAASVRVRHISKILPMRLLTCWVSSAGGRGHRPWRRMHMRAG